MALQLKEANLSAIAKHAIVPNYDRRDLTPNVVHIGVGAFHPEAH